MDLDTNQPCPGGTGKKIRFCCKDMTHELDKIVRLMEGGQRRAAIDMIDKTLTAKGDRACLYALKSEAQAESKDAEGAKQTMAAFAQKFPDSPAALAEGAMAAMDDGRTAEAVDLLQSAVEKSGDNVEPRVYSAYALVAQGLVLAGNLPAARAHLMMAADLSRGQDPGPLELLSRIDRAPQSPVLLKFSSTLETQAPEGANWQDELTRAVEIEERGEWRRALQAMQALAEKASSSPVVRKNIALLTSRLGDQEAASRAWREYSSLADLPWDDRVEAEAIAQVLEPAHEEDSLDEVKIVYAIHDVDRLTEALLSDPRVIAFEGDLRELVEEDETPPKSVFSLLDRPEKPGEGEELTVGTVPNVLGEIFIYGRRTDREARLELEATRDERLETAQQVLAEVAGENLGEVQQEEVAGSTSRVVAALSWRWRFPPNTPEERRQALMDEKRRSLIFEKWPDIPRALLDGRSPREAAGADPGRVRVAGAVLLLELVGEQMRWGLDFNDLRETLGLPRSEPIDPAAVDLGQLPLVRFTRLQVAKLSDEALLTAYRRAGAMFHLDALEKLSREALGRDSLADKIDPVAAHQVLSQTSKNPKDALDHLHKMQDILVKRGESPAQVLLQEFRLRLVTGEGVEECERILRKLQSNHMNEPGIAQQVYQLLMELGVIGPDGRPTGQGREQGEAMASETAAAEPSGLWTPSSPTPPAAPKKSSLWTPDMD